MQTDPVDDGFERTLGHTLRRIYLALVIVDEASYDLWLHTSGASDGGTPSWTALGQSWLMIALIGAVLWRWRRSTAVLGILVLVLAAAQGSAGGMELWLIPAAVAVAEVQPSRRERLLTHMALQAVCLACAGHDPAGSRVALWVVLSIAQALSWAVAVGARALLRRRRRTVQQVVTYREETRRLRADEMTALAREMEQLVTEGLHRLMSLAMAPRPDDGLPLAMEEVGSTNREVLGHLRALVRGLRQSSSRERPEPEVTPSSSARWRHGRQGVAAVLVAMAVATLVPGVALPHPMQVLVWPLATAGAAGLWPVLLGPELLLLAADIVVQRTTAGGLSVSQAVQTVDGCVWGGLLAYGLRRIVAAQRNARESLDEAHRARRREAAGDRELVAREVHDVVGHQLSVTSMRLMEASMSADPARQRSILGSIGEVADVAERDLGVLLSSLRQHDGTAEPGTPLVRPTTAVQGNVEVLDEAGFDVVVDVDDRVDTLPEPVQRTMTRILTESTTNILRHAEPGTRCVVAAGVDPDGGSHLTVTNRARTVAVPHPHSTGWGLAGITERMELLGARFSAGRHGDDWVLDAHFPAS